MNPSIVRLNKYVTLGWQNGARAGRCRREVWPPSGHSALSHTASAAWSPKDLLGLFLKATRESICRNSTGRKITLHFSDYILASMRWKARLQIFNINHPTSPLICEQENCYTREIHNIPTTLFQICILVVSTSPSWDQSLMIWDDLVISNEWQLCPQRFENRTKKKKIRSATSPLNQQRYLPTKSLCDFQGHPRKLWLIDEVNLCVLWFNLVSSSHSFISHTVHSVLRSSLI